jgi:hypothetical protein
MKLSQEVLRMIEESKKPDYEINPREFPIQRTFPKHATIENIVTNTKAYREGKTVETSKGGAVRMYNVDFTPFFGTNSVLIASESQGDLKTSKRHKQLMRVYYCKFDDPGTPGYITLRDQSTGKPFGMKAIDAKVNPCDIFCDCGDFAWRSSLSTEKRMHATIGPTKKEIANYVRKTPPPDENGGMPYANPQQIPFACKHILTLIDMLASKGVIR